MGFALLDALSVNVIFADTSHTIRYMNKASLRTLREMQAHLPMAVDEIVGSSIDVFHKHPARQHALLNDPAQLPHAAGIALGPESMQLEASPVFDSAGVRIGSIAVWSRTTDAMRARDEKAQSLAVAIEELHASISEISAGAAHSASVADDAGQLAGATLDVIEEMAAAATTIGGIVTSIADIAGQSKLLALNATIEAARGGEAGRGFGVVAVEVKELATASQQATNDIAANIAAMQDPTHDAVHSMRTIAGVVEQVRQTASTIAAAVEEQTAVVSEIARTASDATA